MTEYDMHYFIVNNNNRNIQMVSYDTQTKIITITDNENSKYQISQDLNSRLWSLFSNEKIDTNNISSLNDLVQNAYDQIDQNEDLDDDHLGKVAFTESVKEFTGLSMLSVLGLENISGKRYENLANAYARNRV